MKIRNLLTCLLPILAFASAAAAQEFKEPPAPGAYTMAFVIVLIIAVLVAITYKKKS